MNFDVPFGDRFCIAAPGFVDLIYVEEMPFTRPPGVECDFEPLRRPFRKPLYQRRISSDMIDKDWFTFQKHRTIIIQLSICDGSDDSDQARDHAIKVSGRSPIGSQLRPHGKLGLST